MNRKTLIVRARCIGRLMRRSTVYIIGISIYFLLTLSCSAQQYRNTTDPPENGRSGEGYCSSNLRGKIEKFAVGEGDEEILKKLSECPREALIRDTEGIKSQAAVNDSIRIKIAYLFCRLGYQYEENREIIAMSLLPDTGFKDFYPEDVVVMADVLIRNGDTELLSSVLDSASWADGAVSEVVSNILAEELLRDPEKLLDYFENKSPALRKNAGILIRYGLEFDDKRKREKAIRGLKAISRKSQHSKIVDELLIVISQKGQR